MNNWLMELRLNKNVSQTYIAKQSNITRQYYNLIENHRRRPSLQQLWGFRTHGISFWNNKKSLPEHIRQGSAVCYGING